MRNSSKFGALVVSAATIFALAAQAAQTAVRTQSNLSQLSAPGKLQGNPAYAYSTGIYNNPKLKDQLMITVSITYGTTGSYLRLEQLQRQRQYPPI